MSVGGNAAELLAATRMQSHGPDSGAVLRMSAGIRPAPPPPWLCRIVGGATRAFVYFESTGSGWIALSDETSDGTVVVFNPNTARAVVLFDTYARGPWTGAGCSGRFRKFVLRDLFSLGLPTEAWIRPAVNDVECGRPRYCEYVGMSHLFLGPSAAGAGEGGLLRLIRDRLAGLEPGWPALLPPVRRLAAALADPVLPSERAALEAGLLAPALLFGGAPAETAEIRVLPDGSIRFPSLLSALEVLGPPCSIVVKPVPARGEFEAFCRRHGVSTADFSNTIAWRDALVSPDLERVPDLRVVPGPAAFELFRCAASRLLERWQTRVRSLLEAVLEEPIYAVVPAKTGARRPSESEAYRGTGRRTSVSSPTECSGFSEFVTVEDVAGEGRGMVRREQLRKISFPPVCPGSQIKAEGNERRVRILLGMEAVDEAPEARVDLPGVLTTLPLCMSSVYRSGDVTVPLKDIPRLQLSTILCAFRKMPKQHRAFCASLERDIWPQGAVQRERMATVLSRRTAPPLKTRGVCGTCQLNTYSACFAHLHAGRPRARPTPPGATVVDLVRDVLIENDKLFRRRERAKLLKEQAISRRPAAGPGGEKKPRSSR